MIIQQMAARAVFGSSLATDATFDDGVSPAKDVRAIIKRDVETWGEAAQAVVRHTEVSLMKSQVALPKDGDTVTEDGGTVWVITGRLEDDGAVVKCSARKK